MVAAGASIPLTAGARMTVPLLSYQQPLSGAELVAAAGASLTVSDAQPANASSFTLLVTNAAGAITSPAAPAAWPPYQPLAIARR